MFRHCVVPSLRNGDVVAFHDSLSCGFLVLVFVGFERLPHVSLFCPYGGGGRGGLLLDVFIFGYIRTATLTTSSSRISIITKHPSDEAKGS